jgi:hypothetical protein
MIFCHLGAENSKTFQNRTKPLAFGLTLLSRNYEQNQG